VPARFNVWIGLLLMGVVLTLGWYQYRAHRERRYDREILRAGAANEIDPALIKAVIWRESWFDANAKGRAGEIGLMQIRGLAAREWTDARHITGFSAEHLVDPGTNTLAGGYYLAKLLRRYRACDQPLVDALADYNAGRTHVLRWMKGPGSTNSAVFLNQMDFPGTRRYVEAVTDRLAVYRKAAAAAR
jgi:soluble lytic murein transglycosylase